MNRAAWAVVVAGCAVPRTRGDEPAFTVARLAKLDRSPHARG